MNSRLPLFPLSPSGRFLLANGGKEIIHIPLCLKIIGFQLLYPGPKVGFGPDPDSELAGKHGISKPDPSQTPESSESGCDTLTPCSDPFLTVIIESC